MAVLRRERVPVENGGTVLLHGEESGRAP